MPLKKSYPRTQRFLLALQLLGDGALAFLSLSVAFWLRFLTPIKHIGTESGTLSYSAYLPLIIIGTVFFIGSFAYLGLYDARLLLRPHRALSIVLRAIMFWMIAYLGASLALKFEPSISRIFVAISCLTTFFAMIVWRLFFFIWLSRSRFRGRIVQRMLLIGWTVEAHKLSAAVLNDRNHPYEVKGYLSTKPTTDANLPDACQCLGTLDELEDIIQRDSIDIVLIADYDLPSERLLQISNLCERLYVQFKIAPTFFRIFISNLHLQTISGMPVLGVEELPVASLINSMLKRAVDVVGAIVGLILSTPIMAFFAILIKREGPGSIFYKQVRTGRHGQSFNIYKLRSMKVDAERAGGAQWAVEDDPRRTKVGTFMREFNIDELPQFWNVLKGDMSLVGPRPERPELIAQFEKDIPHYNPRHETRPGITGWAQVNGLRGNTSLIERIRYDLYYLENWSIWFDIQIMLLTFIRRKNAY
jgi:exopolysaccharide biosynthesis polyprenyl glycosylphosphotransferase